MMLHFNYSFFIYFKCQHSQSLRWWKIKLNYVKKRWIVNGLKSFSTGVNLKAIWFHHFMFQIHGHIGRTSSRLLGCFPNHSLLTTMLEYLQCNTLQFYRTLQIRGSAVGRRSRRRAPGLKSWYVAKLPLLESLK